VLLTNFACVAGHASISLKLHSVFIFPGMFKHLIILTLSTAFSVNALASSPQSDQRVLFKKAEKLIWKEQSQEFKHTYSQLHFYPLKPYITQKKLINKMSLSDGKEIKQFLDEYKGTPLDWPLRKKWLSYLAKKNRQSLFIEFFTPNGDAELNCRYLDYRLNKGASETVILPEVTKLWVVGKSQPKACDKLFSRWKRAGYMTKELVWQRIALAADGGKHTLIPYLTKLLPKKEQYLAKLWHKVRRDPAYITRLSRFPNKNAKEAQIYAYGIKRLIWRDRDRAIKAYESASNKFNFSHVQQQEIAQKFALALASKGHDKSQEWLSKVEGDYQTDHLIQWQIADVLRSKDWTNIKNKLVKLPKRVHENNQWKYWYARSLVETGDTEQGMAKLEALSKKRHYYGFLAASFVDKPYALQDNPLTISEQEKFDILKDDSGKRAFELFHLSRFHHARLEWNHWMTKLSDREQLVAAKLANEKGWFDRAIFALSRVGYLNDVGLRFPMAFDNEINANATKNQIDPAWAFAIARRESSFMSDAHSSAGAHGLMQVLPGTAKQLTRKKVTKNYLLNAKNNVRIGTKYLRKLLDRHKGNQVLATAAYNAGPHRIKQWLKRDINLPADIWIETIPYKETREYVKSVLAYQLIYQKKVGKDSSLFDDLLAMNITQSNGSAR